MKDVAAMVRRHLEGIVAWAQTRQTNGFLEALNGLYQVAKRRARDFGRFSTIRVGDLPDRRQARLQRDQPSCWATHLKFTRANKLQSRQ